MDKFLDKVFDFFSKVKNTVEAEVDKIRTEDRKSNIVRTSAKTEPGKAGKEGKTKISVKFKCPPSLHQKKNYLIESLRNSDLNIRAKGAFYLGRKKYLSSEVLDILKMSLRDREPLVRYTVASSLGLICSEEHNRNNEQYIHKIKDITVSLRELRKDDVKAVRDMADEALRKIGDKESIDEINKDNFSRFSPNFREMLEKEDEIFLKEFKPLISKEDKNNLVEALYEIDNPVARKKLIDILKTVNIGDFWKTLKSIYKRAEYRMDMEVFGILAWRIETSSGRCFDIEYIKPEGARFARYIRHRRFGINTKHYMMRRIWRYLKDIAKNHPDSYADFSYFFLKNFKDSDGNKDYKKESRRFDLNTGKFVISTRNYYKFSHLWSFNYVVYGKSKRYSSNKSGRKWHKADMNVPSFTEEREEAYPLLWETDSLPSFNLLLEAECEEVSNFAVKVLRDKFPSVFQKSLLYEDIENIFKKSYPFVCHTIIRIIGSNFDINNPDMNLMRIFLSSSVVSVREEGRKLLDVIKDSIPHKIDFIKDLLKSSFSDNREYAIDLSRYYIKKDISIKKDIFNLLISLISSHSEEFQQMVIEKLKSDFSSELSLLTGGEILNFLNSEVRAVQDFGGWMMSACIDPFEIDKKDLLKFAHHEMFSIREGARNIIKTLMKKEELPLSFIILLLDGSWEDTRTFTFQMIEEKYPSNIFTSEMLICLCDSQYKDVQDFGKKLGVMYLTENYNEFLKLTEHRDVNIQNFAFDLIVNNLPHEPELIKKIVPFLKTLLFQVNKGRKIKDRVLKYLELISLENPFVAAEIVPLLKDYSQVITKKDFFASLTILTKIKTKYPYIKCPVDILV